MRTRIIYTDLLINSPTTVTAARDRQSLSKSTAYKYANTLEELDIAEELNKHDNGSTLWRADPVIGVWNSETAVTLSPTVIAVYGATAVDDDLALFVDRHGKAALAPAISATIEYLNGNTTRRGVAAALDVPAVEGIAVSQAIEGSLALFVTPIRRSKNSPMKWRFTSAPLSKRRISGAMSNGRLTPFPSALVLDTSFLRTPVRPL